jgi:hypothetical protein
VRWDGSKTRCAALAAALIVIAHAHALVTFPKARLLNVDEGYLIAFSLRMIDGRFLPYVDAVSLRGPVFYFLTAVAVRIFGPGVFTLRVLAFACFSAVPILMFTASALARRSFTGAVGALGWALLCVGHEGQWDGLAYNSEVLLDVFALGSFVAFMVALKARRSRDRLVWLFGAGLSMALAALSKQVGVVCAAPLAVWLGAAAWSRREHPASERRRWILAFGIGFVLPPALILLRYAVAHELSALYYYMVVYLRDIYALHGPAHRDALQIWVTQNIPLLAFAGVVAAALGARVLVGPGRAVRYDREGYVMTLAFETIATALASNASLRDFGHYYLVLFPWAALFAGHIVEALVRPVRSRAVEAIALVVLALATVWGSVTERSKVARVGDILNTLNPQPNAPICAYLDRHSRAWTPILVWGFRPDLYVECKRKAASRFVYTSFPAGVVVADPAPHDHERMTVPGSREQLIEDLEQSRPEVIVDASHSMIWHPRMSEYPIFAGYLAEHYCLDETLNDIPLYLRKNPQSACPEP